MFVDDGRIQWNQAGVRLEYDRLIRLFLRQNKGRRKRKQSIADDEFAVSAHTNSAEETDTY
jgi:hypothetical protein